MKMLRPLASFALGLSLSISLPFPAFGYQYPLSSSAIREAYLSATEQNAATPDFLAAYTHEFPSSDGPYVASISVVTPYMKVFRRATKEAGYTSQDAVQYFLGKPATLRVEVTLQNVPSGFAATATQGELLQVPDTWHDYKVTLSQGGKRIEPADTSASLLVSDNAPNIAGVVVVAVVIALEFDPENVGSVPTKISVTTPDGQRIKTKFDLSRLK